MSVIEIFCSSLHQKSDKVSAISLQIILLSSFLLPPRMHWWVFVFGSICDTLLPPSLYLYLSIKLHQPVSQFLNCCLNCSYFLFYWMTGIQWIFFIFFFNLLTLPHPTSKRCPPSSAPIPQTDGAMPKIDCCYCLFINFWMTSAVSFIHESVLIRFPTFSLRRSETPETLVLLLRFFPLRGKTVKKRKNKTKQGGWG